MEAGTIALLFTDVSQALCIKIGMEQLFNQYYWMNDYTMIRQLAPLIHRQPYWTV